MSQKKKKELQNQKKLEDQMFDEQERRLKEKLDKLNNAAKSNQDDDDSNPLPIIEAGLTQRLSSKKSETPIDKTKSKKSKYAIHEDEDEPENEHEANKNTTNIKSNQSNRNNKDNKGNGSDGGREVEQSLNSEASQIPKQKQTLKESEPLSKEEPLKKQKSKTQQKSEANPPEKKQVQELSGDQSQQQQQLGQGEPRGDIPSESEHEHDKEEYFVVDSDLENEDEDQDQDQEEDEEIEEGERENLIGAGASGKGSDAGKQKEPRKQEKQKQKEESSIGEGAGVKKKRGGQKGPLKEKKNKSWQDSLYILGFLGVFIGFLLFMRVGQAQYSRVRRLNIGQGYSNLYEALELDSSASQKQIKQSYRRLAVLWHPDKNPDCGKPCAERFQLIASAYEILGSQERRAVYDQTSGTITRIKSKAVQLTESNFESLVMEGREIWIIMVYEDGSNFCEYFSKFWESAIDKYQNYVRFGRINRETELAALQYLPIHVTLIPTILTFIEGRYPEIYTFDSKNPETSLQRFISKSIVNLVTEFDETNFLKFYEASLTSDRTSVFYLASVNQVPIDIKNSAYKLQGEINFYVSKYGSVYRIRELIKSQKSIKFQNNFLIIFNSPTSGGAKMQADLEINDSKGWIPKQYQQIFDLLKLVTKPLIDRSSFKDFCEKPAQRRSEIEDDAQEIQEQQQIMCVFIPKSKFLGALQNEIGKIHQELIDLSITNYQKHKQTWMNQGTVKGIQFVLFDETFHDKLHHLFTQIDSHYELIGLLAENGKYSLPKSLIQTEDWIFDSLDGNTKFSYLQEYLNGREISHLLRFAWESKFYILKKTFTSYFRSWKSLLSLVIIWILTKKLFKFDFLQSIQIGALIYVLSISTLTLIDTYEQIF